MGRAVIQVDRFGEAGLRLCEACGEACYDPRGGYVNDRRILLYYTGGTLGMMRTQRGFAPVAGFLAEHLAGLASFHDPSQPRYTLPTVTHTGAAIRYDLLEADTPIDSANMAPHDWVRIARVIEAHYSDYDAFVILHGTDTMAYTAAALSFMFENLDKTVILTGSQIPLTQIRNDAAENLLGALLLAGAYDIPEVCLYFHEKLWRGNRVQKVDASGLDAFHAGNLRPLATVGIGVQVDWGLVRAANQGRFRVRPITTSNVASIRLYPGLSAELLDRWLQPPLQGVVLETYGAGNAPDNRPDFLRVLREAGERGLIVVNCTQCHRGSVTVDYASGAALADAGVVPGVDLTPEAALTKLAWLLSLGLSRDQIVTAMSTSQRGELSDPEDRGGLGIRDADFVRKVAQQLTEVQEEAKDVAASLYPVLLCSAAFNGDVGALDRMARAGADLCGADYDGRTPLHLAAAQGRTEAVAFLLEHGAAPDVKDRFGNTPLTEAERQGRHEILSMLRDAAELRS